MSRLSIFVSLLLVVALVFCCVSAQAETGFPSYWKHDTGLVTKVQERLVAYGASIAIDGDFGPATARAVKEFQRWKGLTVNGTVDDVVADYLGVRDWPTGKGYTLYYMADLQRIYDKSPYEDLIYIALGGNGYNSNIPETGSRFCLFRSGVLVAETLCITGNEEAGYYTPLGSYTIRSKKHFEDGNNSTYYDILRFKDEYAVHSLLYVKGSKTEVIGGQTLGLHLSDGCIRIPKDLSTWLRKNESKGVTIVIDDRCYMPSSIGYQDLINDEDYADWD